MSIWADLIGGLGAAGGGFAQALEKVRAQEADEQRYSAEQDWRDEESLRRHNEEQARIAADLERDTLTSGERSAAADYRAEMQRIAGDNAVAQAKARGEAATHRENEAARSAETRGILQEDRGIVTTMIGRIMERGGHISELDTEIYNQYGGQNAARAEALISAGQVVTGEMVQAEQEANLRRLPAGSITYDDEGRMITGGRPDVGYSDFFGPGGVTERPERTAAQLEEARLGYESETSTTPIAAMPIEQSGGGGRFPDARGQVTTGIGRVNSAIENLGSTWWPSQGPGADLVSPQLGAQVPQDTLGIPPLPGTGGDPMMEFLYRMRQQGGS